MFQMSNIYVLRSPVLDIDQNWVQLPATLGTSHGTSGKQMGDGHPDLSFPLIGGLIGWFGRGDFPLLLSKGIRRSRHLYPVLIGGPLSGLCMVPVLIIFGSKLLDGEMVVMQGFMWCARLA